MNDESNERQKYDYVWRRADYRTQCHGLNLWHREPELFPVRPRNGIDFGCGTGRLVAQWRREGIAGWGVDLSHAAPDSDIANYVLEGCLWNDNTGWQETLRIVADRFDMGVCADVMEHIPPDHVDAVLENIHGLCDVVVYKIANFPSEMDGLQLHLTLHDADWWSDKLEHYGPVRQVPGRTGIEEYVFRVGR